MRRVYLDNNSTTAIDPRVAAAMRPFIEGLYGNPSNIHNFGRECAEGLALAREQTARFLNADPDEVFFTGSGSEADNWAVKGVAAAMAGRGRHIVISAVEHGAVAGSAKYLESQGWSIARVPVDRYARVRPDDVRAALTPGTVLVSVMLVNNEIGTIEPVREIAAVCRERGVYSHTDAVAAAGKMAVDVEQLGIDLLTISGHKMRGPKGVGALYVRQGTAIHPLIHGGHQERGLRGGTENTIGIVGLGAACELMGREWPAHADHEQRLRNRLERLVVERIPEVRLNGHPMLRAPNVAHFSVGYIEGEALLVSLDLEGVAVASGSACSSGDSGPSATVQAIGVEPLFRNSSVRFSLGPENTEDEIDYAAGVFERVVARLRDISPLWKTRKPTQ